MLDYWHQLFPRCDSLDAVASLPEEEIKEQLHRLPASWPSLARELCTTDKDPDGADIWYSAWDAGLLKVLEEMMNDKYCCGFSRKQLVSRNDGRKTERVANLLNLFSICATRVFKDDRTWEVGQILTALLDTVVGLYARFWTVRDSFLLGRRSIFVENSAVPYTNVTVDERELCELHDVLNSLGRLTVENLKGAMEIPELLRSRIPHVALFTWVYSTDPRTQSKGLSNIAMINWSGPASRKLWKKFLSGVVGGCLSDEDVTNAIARDLAAGDTVDSSLKNVLCFLSIWHEFVLDGGRSLSSYTLLAPNCLAAMRRQQCRGSDEHSVMLWRVASEVFMNMWLGLEIRGRQCYALVDAICDHIMASIQDGAARPPANIDEHLDWAFLQIPHRSTDDRPKTVALRHASLAAWQAVADAIVHHRLAQRPAWAGVARLWPMLRASMLPAPTQPTCTPFAPFERCAWHECLCSRHKPAHRMRMCKGCERVFYCGERCQKKGLGGGRTQDAM
ncbi:zinc finger MYND domain-containing protein [Phanerochaete sordida]|uniref:Zinc finger MYND domain-containing protein n=1 Tax=Phanerochaete sordida TaxID=48140 RepID=A0A9P3GGM0_9APHY|nr:zinc finger MYND domain-containing protein [Phanerochaete sordida]